MLSLARSVVHKEVMDGIGPRTLTPRPSVPAMAEHLNSTPAGSPPPEPYLARGWNRPKPCPLETGLCAHKDPSTSAPLPPQGYMTTSQHSYFEHTCPPPFLTSTLPSKRSSSPGPDSSFWTRFHTLRWNHLHQLSESQEHSQRSRLVRHI